MAYTNFATITFPAPSSGTLTNFTLVFKCSAAVFKTVANGGVIQNTATVNGQTVPTDLIVTTDLAHTSLCSWEVESYDVVNGIVYIWVLIPSYSAGLTLYLAFGNTIITTFQGGSLGSTWDTNYVGVYHLPNGTTLTANDSTSNANNGTNFSSTAAAGQIDGGAGFVSASSQYQNYGTSPTLNPSSMTFSAWINAASFPNAYNSVISRERADTGDYTFLVKSNGKLAIYVEDLNTLEVNYDGTGSHTLSAGTWYYVVFTFAPNSNLIGYVNASQDGTAASSAFGLNAGQAVSALIGNSFYSGRFWDGSIDEVRISNTVRSADWIATEYTNQNSIPLVTLQYAFSEIITITDTIKRSITKGFSEVITITDICKRAISIKLNETITLIDILKRSLTIKFTEIFTIFETFSNSAPIKIVFNEVINLVDSIKWSTPWDYIRGFLSDPLIITGITSPTENQTPNSEDLDYFKKYL